MDNQHQKITGYRDLSQGEIDAMNGVKQVEATFNGLIDYLKSLANVDQRQVALAATHGEEAFMHAVRSIAQPARFATVFQPPQAAAQSAPQSETVSAAAGAGGAAGTGNVELDPVTGQETPKASEQV